MKTLKNQIGIASLAVIASFGWPGTANGADLDLRGRSSVNEGWNEYYSYYGASQGGRYSNLGEGYYRRTTIKVQRIQNHSSWRSGSTSFELWAMPYYGANSGTVLMTTNTGRLWGWSSKWNVSRTGNKMALDDYAFPELNIWEYTRYGWRFRDEITYSYRSWM